MLNETTHIPDAFLNAKAEDLIDILPAPTLFHIEGSNPQPLFISTLLHGNETTGLYAMQRLLKKYKNKQLPRAISLFIGNIAAAKKNQRRLHTQDDYNRIWPGSHHNDSVEKNMMQAITRIMKKKAPFASIDIHNNTGKNPYYGCVNNLNSHGLTLASYFSDIAVYFTDPKGVQSAAFSDFCPSIVLECGQAGDKSGEDHVLAYLETILQLNDLAERGRVNLRLYHTIARVVVPTNIALKGKACDLLLNAELDNKNFQKIQPETVFATINGPNKKHIIVNNESHEDITNEYMYVKNKKLIFKNVITLAMFTRSERAIRQDCVCYFMEELYISKTL